MSKLSLGVIIIFLFSASAHAADSLSLSIDRTVIQNDRTAIQKIGDDISLFGEDFGAYFTAPLHFNGTDGMVAGAIAAGTIGIMPLDNWGQQRAQAAPRSQAFGS